MKMSLLLPLGACAALFLEPLSAQTCRASVGGNYSYSSLGNGIAGSLLNPPSTGTGTTTTTTTSMFSSTEVGSLVSGVAGTTPFAGAGTLHLEGGVITASNTPNFASSQQVGTYTINSDCTISVTLTDSFSTATTGNGSTVANATPSSIKLQGVIMRNGSEIDLGVLQNTPTTTSTTTTGSTTTTATTTPAGSMLQSNSLIVLTRSLSTFCSASNLVGRYAIVAMGTGVFTPSTSTTTGTGTGTGTGTTTTTNMPTTPQVTPFFFFGIVNFDGAGNITSSTSTSSPLSYLNFTGTYKVNPDCSGTMTVNGVAPMTTSTTTTGTTGTTTTTTASNTAANTMTLNFVLTQPVADVSISGQALNAGQAKPRIEFTASSSTQTLSGYGSATEQ